MLTQEQIKKLKPGDKLCCTCSFVETEDYGNRIVVDMCYAGSKERTTSRISYFYEQLSLPPTPPKHDPTRLFKKGDKVRPVKHRGRYYSSTDEKYADIILTVDSDEVTDSRQSEIWVSVETEDDVNCWNTDPVYLELVTPVEELELYYVEEQDSCYVVGKRQEDPEMEYVAGFSKTRHPSARAAAEAECKRLNEEWRKEQNRD